MGDAAAAAAGPGLSVPAFSSVAAPPVSTSASSSSSDAIAGHGHLYASFGSTPPALEAQARAKEIAALFAKNPAMLEEAMAFTPGPLIGQPPSALEALYDPPAAAQSKYADAPDAPIPPPAPPKIPLPQAPLTSPYRDPSDDPDALGFFDSPKGDSVARTSDQSSSSSAAHAHEPVPASLASLSLTERASHPHVVSPLAPPATDREAIAKLTAENAKLRGEVASLTADKTLAATKQKIGELKLEGELGLQEDKNKINKKLKVILVVFLVFSAIATVALMGFTGGLAALPILGALFAKGSGMALATGLGALLFAVPAIYKGISLETEADQKNTDIYTGKTSHPGIIGLIRGQSSTRTKSLAEEFAELGSHDRKQYESWLKTLDSSYTLIADGTKRAEQQKALGAKEYHKTADNHKYDTELYDLFKQMKAEYDSKDGREASRDAPTVKMRELTGKQMVLMQKYGYEPKSDPVGNVRTEDRVRNANREAFSAIRKEEQAMEDKAVEDKVAAAATEASPGELDKKRRAAVDADVDSMELQDEATGSSGTPPPPTRPAPGTDSRSRSGRVSGGATSAGSAAASSSSSSTGVPTGATRATRKPLNMTQTEWDKRRQENPKLEAALEGWRAQRRGESSATARTRAQARTPSPPQSEITKPLGMTDEEWEKTGKEAARLRQGLRDSGLL